MKAEGITNLQPQNKCVFCSERHTLNTTIQARQYVFLVFKQGSKLNKMQGSAEVKQKNAYASFCKYYLFLVLKIFAPFVL